MQHLLLTLAIVLLTIIAGKTIDNNSKQPVVMKVEKEAPKKETFSFSDEKFSVWYSRFDLIVN